eukprot:3710071-Pyramimonas_sp.AAC.2
MLRSAGFGHHAIRVPFARGIRHGTPPACMTSSFHGGSPVPLSWADAAVLLAPSDFLGKPIHEKG